MSLIRLHDMQGLPRASGMSAVHHGCVLHVAEFSCFHLVSSQLNNTFATGFRLRDPDPGVCVTRRHWVHIRGERHVPSFAARGARLFLVGTRALLVPSLKGVCLFYDVRQLQMPCGRSRQAKVLPGLC